MTLPLTLKNNNIITTITTTGGLIREVTPKESLAWGAD